MDLRKVNLNLLKTLHVLLQTRSVTLASQELFLTQPAVSAALRQLRILFDDELLVKSEGKLLELTYTAQQLQPKLEQLMGDVQALVAVSDEAMQPELLTKTFYIASHEHINASVFPKLFSRLSKIAPNVTVHQSTITDLRSLSARKRNQFDFVIGAFQFVPDGFVRMPFFKDRFICLSGIPCLNRKKTMTIDMLNNHDHVALSYFNDYTKSLVEDMMISHGVQRRVRAVVSDTLLATEIAYEEKMLLIMMEKRAVFSQALFPLKRFALPFQLSPVGNVVLYKERDQPDPVAQWFLSVLFSCVDK